MFEIIILNINLVYKQCTTEMVDDDSIIWYDDRKKVKLL